MAVFLAAFCGIGATYDVDDHLRLIGKRVVDVLLVLIELCFSLGVTAEALRTNIGLKSAISLQREPVDPKRQLEGVAPTNHFSSQNTRLNYLSYFIKICTYRSSVLSQCTRLTNGRADDLSYGVEIWTEFFRFVHAFDRRTDGRTEFSSLDRVSIPYSTAKIKTCHRVVF